MYYKFLNTIMQIMPLTMLIVALPTSPESRVQSSLNVYTEIPATTILYDPSLIFKEFSEPTGRIMTVITKVPQNNILYQSATSKTAESLTRENSTQETVCTSRTPNQALVRPPYHSLASLERFEDQTLSLFQSHSIETKPTIASSALVTTCFSNDRNLNTSTIPENYMMPTPAISNTIFSYDSKSNDQKSVNSVTAIEKHGSNSSSVAALPSTSNVSNCQKGIISLTHSLAIGPQSVSYYSPSSISSSYQPYTNQSSGERTSRASRISPAATSPAASATPDPCIKPDGFLLNFDDIPPLAIGDQPVDDVQPMPLFNPYHQFDFSNGFTVVPPPTDPYLPSSKPLLLEFIPPLNIKNSNLNPTPKTLGDGISAGIGSGDRGLTGYFAFNVYNASFGCDSTGPDCDFSFSGFRFNKTSRIASQVSSQFQSINACPSLKNCTLTPIKFDRGFQNLDFFRLNVSVAGKPKIWWMDDLFLGWSNNTCAADLLRLRTHVH